MWFGTYKILSFISGFALASSKLIGSLTMTGPVCSDNHKTSLLSQLKEQLTRYHLCGEIDCDTGNMMVDCALPENKKRDAEIVIYTVHMDISANT